MWRVVLETEVSDMLDKTKSRDDVTGGARDTSDMLDKTKSRDDVTGGARDGGHQWYVR